jgi:hypothetical protein
MHRRGVVTAGDEQHLARQFGHVPLKVEIQLDRFDVVVFKSCWCL